MIGKNIFSFEKENFLFILVFAGFVWSLCSEKTPYINCFNLLDQGDYSNKVTHFLIQLNFYNKNSSFVFLFILALSFILFFSIFLKHVLVPKGFFFTTNCTIVTTYVCDYICLCKISTVLQFNKMMVYWSTKKWLHKPCKLVFTIEQQ